MILMRLSEEEQAKAFGSDELNYISSIDLVDTWTWVCFVKDERLLFGEKR